MNKKSKRLIKDTVVFGIGNISSKMILFFLVPIYTNYLSTEEYGTADLIVVISGLAVSLFSLDIFNALLRFSLSSAENRENVARVSMRVCCVGALAMIVVSPVLLLFPTVRPYNMFFLGFSVINIFRSCGFEYLKVRDKNRVFAFLGFLEAATLALVNIVLICCLDLGVTGYLVSNLVAYGVSTMIALIVSGFISDSRRGYYERALAWRMIVYSFPLMFNSFIWWITSSFGKIVIDISLGASDLGVYTAASKIPSLVNLVIGVFNQAWGLSSIREIEGEKDKSFFSRIVVLYFMVVTGFGIVFISIAKPLVYYFMGRDFQSSWRFIPILMAGAVFYAIELFFGALYIALKKTINSFLTNVAGAVTNVVLTLVLLDYFGVWGAVIGYCAGFFVISCIRMYDMDRYLKLDYSKTRYWLGVLVMMMAAIAVLMDFYGLWVCLTAVLVYLVLYGKVWGQVLRGLYVLAFGKKEKS